MIDTRQFYIDGGSLRCPRATIRSSIRRQRNSAAASIKTADPARAERDPRRVCVGMVHVSGSHHRAGRLCGGYRQSGNGSGRCGPDDFVAIETFHLT